VALLDERDELMCVHTVLESAEGESKPRNEYPDSGILHFRERTHSVKRRGIIISKPLLRIQDDAEMTAAARESF
jgi:hypothetical protein